MRKTTKSARALVALMCAVSLGTPATAFAAPEDYSYEYDYDYGYGYDYEYGYGNDYESGRESGQTTGTKEGGSDKQSASKRPSIYDAISWERLYGKDRYSTMQDIVVTAFSQSPEAIVASGENFPDALCANALAGVLKCPVILTKSYTLSEEAKASLQSLGVTHAYVVGGEGAVSDYAASELEMMGIRYERISGYDRQSTSVNVMRTIRALDASSDTVIVASGLTSADALSIGPYAYTSKSPILLCGANGTLTDEQLAEIAANPSITRAVIVGGEAAVSPEVETQLGGLVVERLGGANRYETSANIAKWETSPAQGLSYEFPVVASAKTFPDALAGGPLSGELKSVLVLADNQDDPTLALLRDNAKMMTGGFVLGGRQAMPWTNPLSGAVKAPFTSSGNIQGLIDYMVTACTEWNLGYDQEDRWNIYDGGECDCSSLVYMALWETGLLPRRESEDPEELWGYTGTLADELMEAGWTMLDGDISLAQPGDILLNEYEHVAVVVSGYGTDAKVAQARNDENSVGVGGSTGDQLQGTGEEGETDITDIYEYYSGWDMILRYGA